MAGVGNSCVDHVYCNASERIFSLSGVEQLLECVHLSVCELYPGRGKGLAERAGVRFDTCEGNDVIAYGIAHAGADGLAPLSRSCGPRRGLEMWRQLRAQPKGVAPSTSSARWRSW